MDVLTTTKDAVRAGAAEARDRIGDRLHRAKDRIELPMHRHPLETVALSVASGLLLGFALGVLVGRTTPRASR